MKEETIEGILKKGIKNELDLERALIADKKLRILSKEDDNFKNLRKKLRDIIEEYENVTWSTQANIDEEKIKESEHAEFIASLENKFLEDRKAKIKKQLKTFNITQEDLGRILGHKSKSYMSELINGINPFSLKDLVIIHRVLKIKMDDLVPVFLSSNDKKRVSTVIETLKKPGLKLNKDDLMVV